MSFWNVLKKRSIWIVKQNKKKKTGEYSFSSFYTAKHTDVKLNRHIFEDNKLTQ